jgi:RNA polymerase sigma-B factor
VLPSGNDVNALFARYRAAEGREREELLARVVERFRGLADRIARGYRDRGESLDDLRQVAAIGLVNAAKRFDADRGTKFVTYATQTIYGEIKRHFRDRGWTVRVPRRLQELNQAARRANDALAQKLGRPPTIGEIAAAVGASEEATLEALELVQHAYDLVSLDELVQDDGDGGDSLGDRVLLAEGELDLQALDVRTAMARLEPRLRRILVWKFLCGYSQAEIAKRLGISQMHVSRLQARALGMVRELLSERRDGRDG